MPRQSPSSRCSSRKTLAKAAAPFIMAHHGPGSEKRKYLMRLLLTGGAGDLGLLLCRALNARGDRPAVLDPAPAPPGAAAHFAGSILDRALLARAVSGMDTVIHIAAWHGI